MGYKNAEEILPIELIEVLQQYVEGESIYIPKREENRAAWGANTSFKREMDIRDKSIFSEYSKGISVVKLAEKYFLSTKSIQRIIRKKKLEK